MVHDSAKRISFFARLRVPAAVGLLVVGTTILAAGGNSGAAGSSRTTGATSGSCSGVKGVHHARLVVEPASGKVLARCVGFSGKGLPALTLLKESHIEYGTQKFSFGVAVCQVDHVPAHYTQCLPSGQPYWALFLSANGRKWTSPSVGVSEITVPPGGSLGLRYDSPNGNPAPPPHPTPA